MYIRLYIYIDYIVFFLVIKNYTDYTFMCVSQNGGSPSHHGFQYSEELMSWMIWEYMTKRKPPYLFHSSPLLLGLSHEHS